MELLLCGGGTLDSLVAKTSRDWTKMSKVSMTSES
jgi:hypothetical protein